MTVAPVGRLVGSEDAASLSSNHPLWQLQKAGYSAFVRQLSWDQKSVRGTFHVLAFKKLSEDPRFAEGELHLLHPEVGDNLRDFRSINGQFGRGSLQIVMDELTGEFYADVDQWNPYQDVVNFIGHSAEVVVGFFRKVKKLI